MEVFFFNLIFLSFEFQVILSSYDIDQEGRLSRSEVVLALDNFNAFYGQVGLHGKLPEFVYGMFKRLAPDAESKLSIVDIIAEVLPWLDEQFNQEAPQVFSKK